MTPFTRQLEGDEVLIGRPDAGIFLALPAPAVELLDHLASGKTVGEARSLYQEKYGEAPDLNDFLCRLEREGFVWPYGAPAPVEAGVKPRSYHFEGFSEPLARLLFGRPMLLAYGAVILLAVGVAARHPELRPGWRDYFFSEHIALMYGVSTLLGYLAVFIHEMAHLVAARAVGVPCRLGIGNRLWVLVAETDMTGIWSVERKRRYLPFLAGPLVDVLCASILLLISFADARGWIALPPLAMMLLRARLFGYVMGLYWQCYFFVRTDFYYVFATFFGCKDLLGDTVTFLRNLLFRLTRLGRHEDQSHIPARERRVIHVYSLVWLAGRALAFSVLFLVTLPLLWNYLLLLFSPGSAGRVASTGADLLRAGLLIVLPQLLGLWLWLYRFRQPKEA